MESSGDVGEVEKALEAAQKLATAGEDDGAEDDEEEVGNALPNY